MNTFYTIHGFSIRRRCAVCGFEHENEIEEPVESDASLLGQELMQAAGEVDSVCPACAAAALRVPVAA